MGAFILPPPDIRQPIVIVNDGGGLVDDYAKAAWQYRLQNRRVEIRGSCRSACTYALTVPNVCVAPGAVLKWHHAYEVATGVPRYDVTEKMTANLPTRIKQRVEGRITVNYNPDATLTYAQLVELGVPSCSNSTVATTTPTQLPVKRVAAKDTKIDLITPVVNLVKLPFIPFIAAARALDRSSHAK